MYIVTFFVLKKMEFKCNHFQSSMSFLFLFIGTAFFCMPCFILFCTVVKLMVNSNNDSHQLFPAPPSYKYPPFEPFFLSTSPLDPQHCSHATGPSCFLSQYVFSRPLWCISFSSPFNLDILGFPKRLVLIPF